MDSEHANKTIDRPETPDRVITINVGGMNHTTTLSTLRSKPSRLKTMFSEDFEGVELYDKDDNLFIDRNGHIFKVILEYLRTGEVINTTFHEKAVKIEFEWFGFDLDKITSLKRTGRKSRLTLEDRYVEEWESSPAHDHFASFFEENFITDFHKCQPDLDKDTFDTSRPNERRYQFVVPDCYLEYMLDRVKSFNKKSFLSWLNKKYNLVWSDLHLKTGPNLSFNLKGSELVDATLIIDVKYPSTTEE